MFSKLRFLTAGESHGPKLTVILEGLPSGLMISKNKINFELYRRQRGYGNSKRMKIESDKVNIFSGIANGISTGAPLLMEINNKDYKNWKQKNIYPMTVSRPGHADLTGFMKYNHFDLRISSERSSARETAMRVCVGSICRQFLEQFNIEIGGYVSSIGKVKANIINRLNEKYLRDYIFQAQSNEFSFAILSMCNKVKE